ncbi:MAG: hypothetical protein ACRBBR_09570 [Cellvibrionaceae bacterium]
MEYILFIHKNTDTQMQKEDWDRFFTAAMDSKLFQGGSEISNRILLGGKDIADITHTIGGFMRFESNNIEAVKELLKNHPTLLNGGSLELCEMPKT